MRIIGTVSMFLATCRLLIEDAPHLQLPFTYEEFFGFAVKKVRHQCEMIAKSDKLAVFFNTMDYLIDRGTLKMGRDEGRAVRRATQLKGCEFGNSVLLSDRMTAEKLAAEKLQLTEAGVEIIRELNGEKRFFSFSSKIVTALLGK